MAHGRGHPRRLFPWGQSEKCSIPLRITSSTKACILDLTTIISLRLPITSGGWRPSAENPHTFVDNHDENRIASKLKNKDDLVLRFIFVCLLFPDPSVHRSDFPLGKIHAEEPAFHHGRYQELLLTNRQYAYALTATRARLLL